MQYITLSFYLSFRNPSPKSSYSYRLNSDVLGISSQGGYKHGCE